MDTIRTITVEHGAIILSCAFLTLAIIGAARVYLAALR